MKAKFNRFIAISRSIDDMEHGYDAQTICQYWKSLGVGCKDMMSHTIVRPLMVTTYKNEKQYFY